MKLSFDEMTTNSHSPQKVAENNIFNSKICGCALGIDTLFESAIGFAALKPEAKILFALGSLGDMSIKQAMLISDVSYRGFYLILERLRNNQLIEIYPDSLDRRVRRIKLLVDIPQNL